MYKQSFLKVLTWVRYYYFYLLRKNISPFSLYYSLLLLYSFILFYSFFSLFFSCVWVNDLNSPSVLFFLTISYNLLLHYVCNFFYLFRLTFSVSYFIKQNLPWTCNSHFFKKNHLCLIRLTLTKYYNRFFFIFVSQ